MRLRIEADIDYALPEPADVLLQIEAAALPGQRIEAEALTVWSDLPVRAVVGEEGVGQRCWIHAAGRLQAQYRATVVVERPGVVLDVLPATPVRALPGALTAYLLPSRYCPVDRLWGFAHREFAGVEGGALAAALAGWIGDHVEYRANATAPDATALDTFATRAGVCRDFAHLLVTLARAGGIPARCVSAYAPGVDPPDFHAVAELWLDGGWHLVDATGMARPEELAIVAVGRDATDIAFMTVFGRAHLHRQRVQVTRLDQERPARSVVLPRERSHARSQAMPDTADRPLDTLSVAPDVTTASNQERDPRQDAGQDASIAARLERDPESKEARLDNALDESMDASDPPASTQPVHNTGPAASSGYDEEAEKKLRGA